MFCECVTVQGLPVLGENSTAVATADGVVPDKVVHLRIPSQPIRGLNHGLDYSDVFNAAAEMFQTKVTPMHDTLTPLTPPSNMPNPAQLAAAFGSPFCLMDD
jgi:hypothetical protein